MKAIRDTVKGEAVCTVTHENSAQTRGSGDLAVFSTPDMCILMEKSAYTSVQPYLEEGESTVGTMLHIQHLSATPIGSRVRAESLLQAVEGKKLTFAVKAYDEAGLIGEGTHERFVVQSERFVQKTKAKTSKSPIK